MTKTVLIALTIILALSFHGKKQRTEFIYTIVIIIFLKWLMLLYHVMHVMIVEKYGMNQKRR